MTAVRVARNALVAALVAGLPAALVAQDLPPSDAAAALAALSAGSVPAQARVPAQGRKPAHFILREVEIATPSGYFPPERLQAVLAPFIGKRITRAGANALVEAVNALYGAEGISLATAWITRIDPARGVVTLDLFEARLGQIVTDSQRLSEAYLARRLGLRTGSLADTRRISARLERLSLTDGLLADAGFSPGAKPGTTDLTIRFAEPPAVQGFSMLENYGADSGDPRLTGRVQFNSPTGAGDTLALDMMVGPDVRWLNASYIRPVGAEGTRVGVSLSGEWEYDDGILRRDGLERSLEMDVSHPLVLSPERALWLIASAEVFDDYATLLTVPSKEQAGFAFSLELNGGHSPGESRLLAASWSVGVTAGRYDDSLAGLGSASFGLLAASGQASLAQGEWGRLSLAGAMQVTSGAATPLRYQFQVTSPKAVAGYPPGLATGDSGLWARAELQAARPVTLGRAALTPFAFAAAGQAFDQVAGNWQGQGVARSAGIGLSGRWGERVGFELQAGWPLSEVLGQGARRDASLRLNLTTTF